VGSGCGGVGIRSEAADEELLNYILQAAYPDADGRAFEDEARTATVDGGVVDVRQAAGHDAAEDAGVVGLAVVVVSLGDDGHGEGVEDAGGDGAVRLIEVAGILFEGDGQDGVAEQGAGEEGSVGGRVTFAEALRALAPVVEVVGLLEACGGSVEDEGDGIDHGTEGEFILLPGVERDGVGDVADVEVGKDAEDALLFFEADLGLGDVGMGGGDVDVGGGGGGKDDGGQCCGFAGLQLAYGLRYGEAGDGDGEGVGAGREIGDGELSFGCGDGAGG
jgi:hypothetical protein